MGEWEDRQTKREKQAASAAEHFEMEFSDASASYYVKVSDTIMEENNNE